MIKLYVNEVELLVKKGTLVIEACEEVSVSVPRYCYSQAIDSKGVGNCRYCLVEVKGVNKLVAACTQEAMEGMYVYTDTAKVRKGRENVTEMLLGRHPLDCPVCDEGGECDLQDQSMSEGSERSRRRVDKRTVEDKESGGPLIKMVMTRCIQCTRCVRYEKEVSGKEELGMLGRGDGEEIGVYDSGRMRVGNMSGNLVDVCPVGYVVSNVVSKRVRK